VPAVKIDTGGLMVTVPSTVEVFDDESVTRSLMGLGPTVMPWTDWRSA